MRIPLRVAGVVATIASSLFAPAAANAATPPSADPFYTYSGPLAGIAPGTVLRTRTGTATLPVPVPMVQLLYRTRDLLGNPTVTVTTVLKPAVQPLTVRVVSYQSFYDSLTQRCEPSYTLNGGPTNETWTAEQAFVQNLVNQGYTVVVSDFEGQDPAFATGPIYGYQTLDGIRAAYNSPDIGLPAGTQVAMLGYSGGAIATEWATELAATYAPEVDAKLVGSAFGGVFVHPVHNLYYTDGSDQWSSTMPLAFIGIAKAFRIDLKPYLSPYGLQLIDELKNDCIKEHSFPNLTFASLVKPQYAVPESVPPLVDAANALIMGTGGTPTVPMFIRQGTGGEQEGTKPSPTYGPGDGVMISGDVRTLARKYCAAGRPIDYAEAPIGHTAYGATFMAEAAPWVLARFVGGVPATNTCGTIRPGNSIEPSAHVAPGDVPETTPPGSPGTGISGASGGAGAPAHRHGHQHDDDSDSDGSSRHPRKHTAEIVPLSIPSGL